MSETVSKSERVTIVVPIEVDVQRLRDLLCSAIEGGSNYWAFFRDALKTTDADWSYQSVEVCEQESHKDDGPGMRLRVSAEDLANGLKRLGECALSGTMKGPHGPIRFPAAGQHLANFLGENDDAETADVVLQMTVFGTLIYG